MPRPNIAYRSDFAADARSGGAIARPAGLDRAKASSFPLLTFSKQGGLRRSAFGWVLEALGAVVHFRLAHRCHAGVNREPLNSPLIAAPFPPPAEHEPATLAAFVILVADELQDRSAAITSQDRPKMLPDPTYGRRSPGGVMSKSITALHIHATAD